MTLLNECFLNHLLSRFGSIPWNPRSPDLARYNFFLWDYPMSRVYAMNPTSLHELKNNILSEIKQLSPDTLRGVIETTKNRSPWAPAGRGKGGHLPPPGISKLSLLLFISVLFICITYEG